MKRYRNLVLTLIALGLVGYFVWWGDNPDNLNRFIWRILNLGAMYAIAAVGYTVINGIAGQFSLGPHGFMLLGGYMVALLMLPLEQKAVVWLFKGKELIWPFSSFTLPSWGFILALLAAGVLAALAAVIVGIPALRALRGDYLAIATFGFGEIVFVLVCNLIPLTNGPMGIKGIPDYTNLAWSFGALAVLTYAALRIKNSSYGRALRAIREDEIAAESMGINVFRLKMLAFIFSAFCAGVAGGLWGPLIGTLTPDVFRFFMTFYLLIIIVLGGLGSITGAVVTGFIFAALFEMLRFLDTAIVPGMRMVFFAILLIALMLFFRRGLFGESEFSWDGLFRGAAKVGRLIWRPANRS